MGGSVVVVGGGPGGVLLTYLLARGGVAVTLLEARGDFARRFRGDTLAPGVLEYLDRLGLADELLAEVPYTRSDAFRWHTAEKTWTLVDYRGASRRFPFYALMPQARFLPWLVERAQRYGARVEMGARFRTLCHDAAGKRRLTRFGKTGARLDNILDFAGQPSLIWTMAVAGSGCVGFDLGLRSWSGTRGLPEVFQILIILLHNLSLIAIGFLTLFGGGRTETYWQEFARRNAVA